MWKWRYSTAHMYILRYICRRTLPYLHIHTHEHTYIQERVYVQIAMKRCSLLNSLIQAISFLNPQSVYVKLKWFSKMVCQAEIGWTIIFDSGYIIPSLVLDLAALSISAYALHTLWYEYVSMSNDNWITAMELNIYWQYSKCVAQKQKWMGSRSEDSRATEQKRK